MKSKLLYLAGLVCIFLIACNKSDSSNDTNNPPAVTRDWFKLKTILKTTFNKTAFYSGDSTDVQIDSVNNKIILKQYGLAKRSNDTSIQTFTYNSNNQLVLYEHIDAYTDLYISRMEFVRNANGQVTKVLSQYKNGVMASSEGTVTYDKRGDTTFITFLDSAHKHTSYYEDGQDYYQQALVNNKVVYIKSFPIISAYRTDSSVNKLEYDAAGNLITETYQYGKYTPDVYTYQYQSEQLNDYGKFIKQLSGDLFWFYRKNLFFLTYAEIGQNAGGNVLQTVKRNNTVYLSYTNGFDVNGNLSTVSHPLTNVVGGSYSITTQYKYRP
ncbi:hypothetical protein A3860_12160 [Niastella vici]|uniref:DUF4595 domain-containing protein n=1 Tax=Niastella vici TaxID=1703345 RepID=A0A1V9G6I0_9BACT|nr:hypothetical protein [Niastella vici]OQP66251.1 hypothetical protein A3860_12160 [Niastella vici]